MGGDMGFLLHPSWVAREAGRRGSPSESGSVCGRRTAAAVPRVSPRMVDGGGGGEPKGKKGVFEVIGETLSAFQRLVGVQTDTDESLLFLGEEGFDPLFDEEAPTVLVVGATGEVGRIIVRKLLLRGYKVRVLVRDLFSKTLDLLGTGVSYVMGDLNNTTSLMEAVTGVDKVICAVRGKTPEEAREVELVGVQNLIRAFHDVRHADYGRSEATKLTLFKFERDKDFSRWAIVDRSQDAEDFVRKPAKASFWRNNKNKAVFSGKVFDTYTGHAELACNLKRLNMRGFSGFILRCIGDGKQYRMVLRTGAGDEAGVVYETIVGTVKDKWITVRLPLVSFKARSRTSAPISRDLEEVDRSDVRQIVMEYRKPLTNPERDSGEFCVTVDYMKAYRTQDEADFIFVSCAKVTEAIRRPKTESVTDTMIVSKWKGEEALRNSGISYCIVRAGQFTEQTGGSKALVLEQNTDVPNKEISRVDLADVCVTALQDPRARNVTFDAYESVYAPTAVSPSRQISSLLEGLRPNS